MVDDQSRPRTVSLPEIARVCGVSRQTVGFILRGDGERFLPETRDKVLGAAARLGWRPPNRIVRATRVIALLLDRNPYRTNLEYPLLCVLERKLSQHGYLLHLVGLPGEELPATVAAAAPEGLLLNWHGAIPTRLTAGIAAQGLPCVAINTRMVVDCVYPDEHAATAEAARQLIAAGCMRPALLTWLPETPIDEHAPTHFSLTAQVEGFVAAVRAAGLPPHILRGRFSDHFSDRPMTTVERYRQACQGAAFDGVVVPGGEHDIHLLRQALGPRCPRHLATIEQDTFNSHSGVLRMIRPWRPLAEAAVAMLLDKISRPGPRPAQAVPFTFLHDGPTW